MHNEPWRALGWALQAWGTGEGNRATGGGGGPGVQPTSRAGPMRTAAVQGRPCVEGRPQLSPRSLHLTARNWGCVRQGKGAAGTQVSLHTGATGASLGPAHPPSLLSLPLSISQCLSPPSSSGPVLLFGTPPPLPFPLSEPLPSSAVSVSGLPWCHHAADRYCSGLQRSLCPRQVQWRLQPWDTAPLVLMGCEGGSGFGFSDLSALIFIFF